MKIIECCNLVKDYHREEQVVRTLDHVNLTIERGSFVALMGPSGSGKTTLLNLLAGIDRPTEGSLIVDGHDIVSLSRAALAAWRGTSVGYIFQLYNLIPVLTAYENVELPLLLQAMTRAQRHSRVAEALETVGLSDRYEHYPRQLSGGQEQRVAIARAIVTNPSLLLADEPTGDLDRESAQQVMELLCRFNRERGQTTVMVTHDAKTAAFASRLIRLDKGRILDAESASERMGSPERRESTAASQTGASR
ncbi:MAG: ABC transporter ATP-binding protein [Phycisphaerales bacterium]|nr:ABC transporter ATP-binding protein [Phycisphaerales bacterium]